MLLRKFILVFVFAPFFIWSQQKVEFHAALPKDLQAELGTLPQTLNIKSWAQFSNALQLKALGSGYFLFEAKLEAQNDSLLVIQLNAGPKFDGITIADAKKQHFYTPNQVQSLIQDSIQFYLDNGFPFVQVSLQIPSAIEPQATITIDKGPIIFFGDLVVKPEGIVAPKVLSRLLHIENGAPFSERLLLQAQQQLGKQAGFQMLRNPEWLLKDEKAEIYIYLERAKASSATGILGLQPNTLTQKNALVGELQLNLQNFWQKNEKFNLNWRSIAPGTQQLDMQLNWPYIAASAYGIQTGLKLYKRDTSFIELKAQLGVQYQMPKAWQVLGLVDFWSSSTIAQGAANQIQSFSNLSYGFGMQRRVLNHAFNPSKGQVFHSQFLVGSKKSATELLTIRFQVSQQQYFLLAPRHTLLFQQQLSAIYSDSLFRNELYRFGGLDRMRGFNEEAFFASGFLFSGLEYRFIVDEYAYFSVFTDWATYQNRMISTHLNVVNAVGVGLAVGSKNGMLRLNYAIGANWGEAYQLRAGKIHLSYISYF
jgi:outer membrane protein assembly factor BamA